MPNVFLSLTAERDPKWLFLVTFSLKTASQVQKSIVWSIFIFEIPLGSAMQVETDDFILSLTSGDEVDSNGQTEIVSTEASDLPADLVNTDVSELVNLNLLSSRFMLFTSPITSRHDVGVTFIPHSMLFFFAG